MSLGIYSKVVLASNLRSIYSGLTLNFHWIYSGLTLNFHWIYSGLTLNFHWIYNGLASKVCRIVVNILYRHFCIYSSLKLLFKKTFLNLNSKHEYLLNCPKAVQNLMYLNQRTFFNNIVKVSHSFFLSVMVKPNFEFKKFNCAQR